MKSAQLLLFLGIIGVAGAFAGFKVKRVEPKPPEKYQVHTTVAGVTYAADLLIEGKEQKKYFYKELNPSNIVAVRLAVFNGGTADVTLPITTLQLLGPDGTEIPPVDPDTVAEAVLQGRTVVSGAAENPPVAISPGPRSTDPRLDPSDPRYDPTMDPTRPGYDPNDPRNRYPNDPNYGGAWGRPGVDVVLAPGGGSNADLTEHERALVLKDFEDKSHSAEPVITGQKRDKFLYFSITPGPSSVKGFKLRLKPGKGIPQEVVPEF